MILLVEDDPAHVMLIREALAGYEEIKIDLQVVSDGARALRWLEERLEGAARKLPHLILLDLNLPRISGLDILEWLSTHQDPRMSSIPVVVFTTSRIETDIVRARSWGAAAYIVKPVSFRKFEVAIRSIPDFYRHSEFVRMK